MPMQNLVKKFIQDMRLEGRAQGTLTEYEARLKEFFQYLKSEKIALKDLTNADIKAYIRFLLQKKQKITTVRGKISAVRVFNVWAVQNGYMSEVVISPTDYPKNTAVKRIRRLSDEEMKIFSSYIDTLRPNARAAFYLMIGSGCRVGEAAHLRPEDVTLRGKQVYVAIHEAKWGSDRTIPIIDSKAAKIVWRYREDVEIDSRPLFRLSKRTLQGYATTFAQKTGIPFHSHLLRHTFAGKLTEKGVALTTIQYLLGHKSLGMTAHYAQSALVDLTDATNQNIF